MADLSKLSERELLALYQKMRAAPKAGGVGQGYNGPSLLDDVKQSLPAVPIATGYALDKVATGMRQANTAAEVIKSELTGKNSTGYTQQLGALEREQAEKDALYAPLKREFPKATSVGEALPVAAAPMGQATAMARIMAPATFGAATEAMKYGTPQERAIGAARRGAEGIIGGAAGEGVRRFIQPIPNAVGGAMQDEARTAAAAIPGARLLPSQTTGSVGMRAVEDWLAQSPGGRGPISGVIDGTRNALTRHAAKGIGVPDADALTPDVLSRAAQQISDDYARLSPGVKLDIRNPAALAAVERAEKALMEGAKAGKEQALTEVRRLKDAMYGLKEMPGEQWRVWQSDLGSLARSTENDRVGAILGGLRKELNEYARGPAAKEWSAIDKRNAYLETLMKPNAIIDGQVNPKAIDRLLSSQFGKTYQTGKLAGELSEIGRYGAAVRNPREGSQTFARQEMDSLYGLAKALFKYPAAKAVSSPGFGDYLSKGLLASPEASKVGATLLGTPAVPLVAGPVDLGLLGFLANR